MQRHVACAAIGLLAATAVMRASEFSDDLAARRARLLARLGSDSMLIVLSAPTRRYSLDVDYEYRQDSNSLLPDRSSRRKKRRWS